MFKTPIIALSIFAFIPNLYADNTQKQEAQNIVPIISDVEIDRSKLSSKTKRIINNIYHQHKKNYSKQQKRSDSNKNLSLKRFSSPETDISNYENVTEKSNFDIIVKKPAKTYEKRNKMHENAYNNLIAGQYETAIILYQKILDIYYKDELSLVGIASAYHKLADVASARKFYSKTLKINPTNQFAVNNFLILIAKEAPSEALHELLEVEKVSPNNHIIKAQIGYLYSLQKKYDKAIEYLQTAILLTDDNIKYKYNLAVIYDMGGHYSQAKDLYQKILYQSNDDTIKLDKIRNRVRELNMRS